MFGNSSKNKTTLMKRISIWLCALFAVYVKSAVGEVAVSVYTIDGKRMASVPVVMDGIVAEGLSKGIYVVKLIGNTVCLSRKVVMDE